MSAAKLLADARGAGVQLWRDGERVRWRGAPSDSLIDRLRAHKAELIEILGGDRCRHCGERMAWPSPVGVVFGDGSAAHIAGFEEADAERLMAAAARALVGVIATSDEGEVLRAGDEPLCPPAQPPQFRMRSRCCGAFAPRWPSVSWRGFPR